MAHNKVYGICENKCQVEVLPKEDCCAKNHASSGVEYGVGSTSEYGHVKITNDVSSSVGSQDGIALGAVAGYELNRKFNDYYTKSQADAKFGTDTGWRTLVLTSGVSAATEFGRGKPQYRKIGNHVFIRGSVHIPAITETITIANLPSGFIPTGKEYVMSPAEGTVIAQVFINTQGQLKIDWVVNLSDGKQCTTAKDVQITLDYYVD